MLSREFDRAFIASVDAFNANPTGDNYRAICAFHSFAQFHCTVLYMSHYDAIANGANSVWLDSSVLDAIFTEVDAIRPAELYIDFPFLAKFEQFPLCATIDCSACAGKGYAYRNGDQVHCGYCSNRVTPIDPATLKFGLDFINCQICGDRHILGDCGFIQEDPDPAIVTSSCENCGTMYAGKNGYAESMALNCCKVNTEVRIYAASMFSSTGFMTCLASNLPNYAIQDARYFLAQWEYQVSDFINGRDLNSAQELIPYTPAITPSAILGAQKQAQAMCDHITRKQGQYTSLAVGKWARNKMPAIMRQKNAYKNIENTDIAAFNTHYGILAIWRKQDNTEALKAIAISDYSAPVKRAIRKY